MERVLWSYSLPLLRPLPGQGGSMERRGLVLGIRNSSGGMGYGEAAPLRGLHEADLAQAAEELGGYVKTGSMEGLSGISRMSGISGNFGNSAYSGNSGNSGN